MLICFEKQVWILKCAKPNTKPKRKRSLVISTAQKMKLSIKGFFSKSDQILRKPRIWSHLLKKSLTDSASEYFEKLTFKKIPKDPTLNGKISRSRKNSESKLKYYESSLNFLQKNVFFFASFTHLGTRQGTPLPATPSVTARGFQGSKSYWKTSIAQFQETKSDFSS